MAGFDFQDLLNALIAQESRGDPSAVSKRGAVGLMQIMPQHAGVDPKGPKKAPIVKSRKQAVAIALSQAKGKK